MGLYLHIPFCRQACHYCDFHFTTNLKGQGKMVEAIRKELSLRKDFLSGNELETIYFGGGTPSLLTKEELRGILDEIRDNFSISKGAEITLEANPEDLSPKVLDDLQALGVNRLSIGIQSFNQSNLEFINRCHSGEEALRSVQDAQKAGFDNISIDLIYGIHTSSQSVFEEDVEKALSLNVQHLSAYCLTIEEKTFFGRKHQQGALPDVDDEKAIHQFKYLVSALQANGFEHYEISNFAKEGYRSKHNTSYWQDKIYLGVGPGAHSYDGESRQYNVTSNNAYVRALEKGEIPFEKEVLSRKDRINEYLMTSLRTVWGTDLRLLRERFGYELDRAEGKSLQGYLEQGLLAQQDEVIRLTEEGKLFADQIASDFFVG